MKCQWCGEAVQSGEQDDHFRQPMHKECGYRQVAGSAAHILRRCSCYIKGSKLEDPPNMTKREAARASWEVMGLVLRWWGEDTATVPIIDFGDK